MQDMKNISNTFSPTVYGIGYFGIGNYLSRVNKEKTKSYIAWGNALRRCYVEKTQEKRPTYIGCSIDERWHNFQNFAKWFEENYVEGWHLDKDILIKGNKVYSPETCCFVPPEINCLFTKRQNKRGTYLIGVCYDKETCKFMTQMQLNRKTKKVGRYKTELEAFRAYKTTKELYIKEVADKWKDLIDPRVYEAMYNYQVEITD